jgi:hypothetical protein
LQLLDGLHWFSLNMGAAANLAENFSNGQEHSSLLSCNDEKLSDASTCVSFGDAHKTHQQVTKLHDDHAVCNARLGLLH